MRGVFLVTTSGRVIGQQRDNKITIDNPGMVGPFGGNLEPGEDASMAAWREITQEETNLVATQDDFKPFHQDVAWRKLTGEWVVRHFFWLAIDDAALESLEVYEGEGWYVIEGVDDPRFIATWRPVLERLFKLIPK